MLYRVSWTIDVEADNPRGGRDEGAALPDGSGHHGDGV